MERGGLCLLINEGTQNWVSDDISSGSKVGSKPFSLK